MMSVAPESGVDGFVRRGNSERLSREKKQSSMKIKGSVMRGCFRL